MKRFMSMILMAAVVVTSVVVPNVNNVETVKAVEVDAGVAQVASGVAISAPVKTETGAYEGYETYFDWVKSHGTNMYVLDDVIENFNMTYRELLVKEGDYVIPEEYTTVITWGVSSPMRVNEPDGTKKIHICTTPLIICKPDGTEDIVYRTNGYDYFYNDRDGYDIWGWDFWDYDKDGYDKEGYNKEGYNRSGYGRDGYDKDGYDRNGINKELSEKDIVVKCEDADFNEEEITSDSNKIKWVKNFRKKIVGKNTLVYIRNRDGILYELENAKLTMKKVSVNKKGYGTYNLIINSKVYGVFTIKVVVVPNNCGDICWRMFFSSGKGATRGNLQISLTNPCDGTDGVQYTIGKTKNSNSTKFIKTYKKMTCKKFNKKYVYYIANFTNIKRSATANICVKYRTYAVMNNGKKLYSEWQYE